MDFVEIRRNLTDYTVMGKSEIDPDVIWRNSIGNTDNNRRL